MHVSMWRGWKRVLMVGGFMVVTGLRAASAQEIPFSDVQLPTKLGVGYAVQLLDMNDDKRLDICVVDQERILWLENPTWQEHILIEKQTKKDNVCFAAHDIDRDGKLDFAVGADWRPFDTQTGGTIQWISGKGNASASALWKVHPIDEIPTVHRMAFADVLGDSRPELVVVPLMGKGSTKPHFGEAPVEVTVYSIPKNPTDAWTKTVISNQLHVCHNFVVTDFNHDGKTDVVVVAFEGVYLLEKPESGTTWKHTHVGVGNQQQTPNRGASEIKIGKLGEKTSYIATIEPWHGNEVVVYTPPKGSQPAEGAWLWERHLLDDQLKWGHAVACANLDDDPEEELVIGVRDTLSPENACGVRIYDPVDAAAGKWKRQMLDPGSVAVEDLVVGDVNGDGKMDIVAVGRATHNVKIYFQGKK